MPGRFLIFFHLHFSLAILLAASMLLTNACGAPFTIDEGLKGSACAADLLPQFSQHMYPFFRNNCVACHTSVGVGKGAFADANVNVAYNAFVMTDLNKITNNATSPNHAPPYTGTQNQATWTAAKDAFLADNPCVEVVDDNNPPPPPPPATLIMTSNKALNNITATYQTYSWDFANDLQPSLLAGVRLTLRGRLFTVSGTTLQSYEFRDITVINNSTKQVKISGIHFHLNDQLVPLATTYSQIDATLNVGETRLLSPAVQIIDLGTTGHVSTNVIALEFDQLQFL